MNAWRLQRSGVTTPTSARLFTKGGAVSDPGEARARLEDAMALVCTLGQPPHHEDRVFVSSLLTAALALPYDLIELLVVESGALHQWSDEPEGPGMEGRTYYERVHAEGSRNDG